MKCDFLSNLERYNVCLVAKDFTQKEGINYKESFSPVSKKDSFRINHHDIGSSSWFRATSKLNEKLSFWVGI